MKKITAIISCALITATATATEHVEHSHIRCYNHSQLADEFVIQLYTDLGIDLSLVLSHVTTSKSEVGYIVVEDLDLYDPILGPYYTGYNIDHYRPGESVANYIIKYDDDFYYPLNDNYDGSFSGYNGFGEYETLTGELGGETTDKCFEILVLDENLAASLLTGFTSQTLARQLPGNTINGAHHRLLIDTPVGATGWHTWATGDFSSHDALDADQAIGEIGASRNIGSENLRVGLGLGYSSLDQDMVYGGESDVSGQFFVAEVNYKLVDSPLVLSALAYYGDWDADVTRGYLNTGLEDNSKGNTDIRSLAFRLRADWQDLYTNGQWSVTPRISYTGTDTKGDSYTETGGGFPVTFDGQDNFEHEIRVGADIDYKWNEKTEVRTILEVVKRFEDDSNLSGTIIGVGGFSYPTTQLDSTWGRLGVEVSHQLKEGHLIRTSLFGATEGGDPTILGSVSYNWSF